MIRYSKYADATQTAASPNPPRSETIILNTNDLAGGVNWKITNEAYKTSMTRLTDSTVRMKGPECIHPKAR